MELILRRIAQDGKEAIGMMMLYDGSKLVSVFVTLERTFDGFPKIALGNHKLIKYYSPKFQKYLWKFNNEDEKGRYFEIHYSNYYTDLQGCLAIGRSFQKINSDEEIDITDSKSAFRELMKLTEKYNHLTITIQ